MPELLGLVSRGVELLGPIVLDTMVFLYHFEANPRFVRQTVGLLSAVEQGKVAAVASTLVATECLSLPLAQGRNELVGRYRDLLRHFPNLALWPVDLDVAELAAQLRADHALRIPDALHLATALACGATAFVTADRRLQRVSEVPVVLMEPE